MALVCERKYREVVDGIEYIVTVDFIRAIVVYDPVRTPEQQEKHDREIRAAINLLANSDDFKKMKRRCGI